MINLLDNEVLNKYRRIKSFTDTIYKSSESDTSKSGSLSYYLLCDELGIKSHDKIDSISELSKHLNGEFKDKWEYIVDSIMNVFNNDLEVLSYKINYSLYKKFQASYTFLKHNASIYKFDSDIDWQMQRTLPNVLFYLPYIRTNYVSIGFLSSGKKLNNSTCEHFYPRKLSTQILLEALQKNELNFKEFMKIVVSMFLQVHTVISEENNTLMKYQSEEYWDDFMVNFHPDAPYVLSGIRLIDKTNNAFKKVESSLIQALNHVIGIDVDRLKNYNNEVLIYSKFMLDLPDNYEELTDVYQKNLIKFITYLEDNYEKDENTKVCVGDICDDYNANYGSIFCQLHTSIISKFLKLWPDIFKYTSAQGKTAYLGLKPLNKNIQSYSHYSNKVESFRNKIQSFTNKKLKAVPTTVVDNNTEDVEIVAFVNSQINVGDFIPTRDLYERYIAHNPNSMFVEHSDSKFFSRKLRTLIDSKELDISYTRKNGDRGYMKPYNTVLKYKCDREERKLVKIEDLRVDRNVDFKSEDFLISFLNRMFSENKFISTGELLDVYVEETDEERSSLIAFSKRVNNLIRENKVDLVHVQSSRLADGTRPRGFRLKKNIATELAN